MTKQNARDFFVSLPTLARSNSSRGDSGLARRLLPCRSELQPPHPDIVTDLARRGAYPTPPDSISVKGTHASWVFLGDTEVWKVKRPVNYGFLDFSDAEKRRQSCEAEVRLGARLAPGVYLGVAPVYLGADGHSFVGPGEVVDHAVHMRRLSDQDSAPALLARNDLLPQHLRSLAAQLADFYAGAPKTPGLGAPALLSANIAENWLQTQPYLDRYVDGASVATLYHWQEGCVFADEARLRERQTSGRIREGHGDLRLEHVYFPAYLEGRPLVIDPIEFNRRFRCGDVALDIAFLSMELDAIGRPELAAFFLSQFARATNDYEFFPLVDLYSSYRAWIRAKVACFVAADPSTPADKSRRKAREASRLIRLALSYTKARPTTSPVIAVSGPIAAGKSALSEALSLELRHPAISSDATRKGLAGLRPTEPAPTSLYTPEQTRRTYAELARRAQCVLDSGRGVILDATFSDPGLRAVARDLARANNRPFLLVELCANEKTLRGRLARRASQVTESDAREQHLTDLLQAFRPPTELPPDERLVLDAEAPLPKLVARVKACRPAVLHA